MKVLHILSGDLWAGAEVQAYTLLAELSRTPGVQVAAILMNEGVLAQRLRALGIPVTVLPENRLNAWQLFRGLRRLLAQWQPDIVHTHRFKENILGSLANRFSVRARCLRTEHGARETKAGGPRLSVAGGVDAVERACAALQQAIIAVTADLAGKLEARYPADKLVVIENGIDVETVRAAGRQTPGIPFDQEKIHLGIAGRLTAVKRVDLFLETAALLRRQDPDRQWEFHLFGDGPLRPALAERAQALGLGDSARFHGHREDVAACIARLDALIMCSDHEGLPMTLLEAMAMGTPVVGHAVGGIHELLANGSNGWPVTRHDAAGYSEAVVRALADPAARTTRARAAAANIEQNYSSTLCARRHLGLYSRLTSTATTAVSVA